MSDRPRPPRLVGPTRAPADQGLCTVTIRTVVGAPFVAKVPHEVAAGLRDEFSATWRRERLNSFTFNDTNGSVTIINPDHVVSVEFR